MRISALGNKLLQANTLDNKTFASEPEKIGAVIGLSTNLILLIAAIIRPFIPTISDSIARQLGIEPLAKDGLLADELLIVGKWQRDRLKPGHAIGEPARLFEPIDVKKEEVWRDEFGGEEVRKAKEEKRLKAEKRRADRDKKKGKKTGGADAVGKVEKKIEELKV
jgi:methionyl-tRNA synthetase